VARELINRIQNLRKDSGFEVTDRVKVEIERSADIEAALADFSAYVCEQTLAEAIAISDACEGSEVEWEEGTIRIKVEKL
jgi:hypothetical protein